MTLIGTLTKVKREDGLGSFYQLTTETGIELALTMTESTTSVDDAKVLDPLISKKVEADGIIRKQTGQLLAFSVKPATET